MRRMRLYSMPVVSRAFRDKFPLFIGLLLLTGCLHAGPSIRPIVKAKSHFNTVVSQNDFELFQACATSMVPSHNNNPDAAFLENADDEFKSLKKHAEGSSCSLSVFVNGSILFPKYFYFPASSRYIIFSAFRI